ncbi:MAG TPA: MerR family transcriptional regulator [Acidobacteriaceae bacterium]|nr:MerR family transcriptional regulator [Acidobacteriaceae bacterium]
MGIQAIRKYVAPEIPDKLYFRIGDVARLCEVPAYVLRFWETEFPQLRPNKGGTGQRLYRKRDVEMAMRIKSLLYDQGYTIPGARQVFKNEAKAREAAAAEVVTPMPAAGVEAAPTPTVAVPAEADRGEDLRRSAALRSLREELRALLTMLERPLSPTMNTVKAAPKLQAMRPRLVLEPKPVPVPVETLRLVGDPRLQGDLFPGE